MIAIAVKSVYGLFILCVDVMYVIQMPELTCALWFKPANGYGSFVGFIVGLLLRALAGEPILKFPAVIKYPGYDDEFGQVFPHKTFAMLCCFACIIGVSLLTNKLFLDKKLDRRFDIFNVFPEEETDLCETKNINNVELKSDKIFDDEKKQESMAFLDT